MSTWYETEESDIDINTNNDEVNLFICGDDHGGIYKTLTFEQIERIYIEIDSNRIKKP